MSILKYTDSWNKMWRKQIVHDTEDPRNHDIEKSKKINPSVSQEFISSQGDWGLKLRSSIK